MNAIFGVIGKKGPVEQAIADKIGNTFTNRIADKKNTCYYKNIVFGNHQVTINKNQQNEVLPYQDDRYLFTADVRLDNRYQLYILLGLQQKLSEIPDSLLILNAFKKWGKNCTNYLEGEFVFVIWDKEARSLFAATDHIGFRSLYYYHSADYFIFSSEIKGVLAVKKAPHYFNQAIIIDFITANHSGETFDKEIYALKSASVLLYNNYTHQISITKYWDLRKLGKYRFKQDQEWADCLRDLLTQSIQNRLHTDRPVGLSLSGGLDSSLIAAITAIELRKQNKILYTFSNVLHSGHIGLEKDEKKFIQLMGKQYPNIVQSYIELPIETGPFDNIEDTFERTEALCYPSIYIDKALYASAMEKKIGVFLSGFGGDFTISSSGDSMVFEMLRNGNIKKAFAYFSFLKRHYNMSLPRSIKALITDYSFLEKIYAPLIQKVRKKPQVRLNNELLQLTNSKIRFAAKGTVMQGIRESINTGTIGGILYNSQRKLGANFKMDIGVPIFDKKICEFFLDVPPEQFLLHDQQRSLMRRAMADIVPKEICQRNDKGSFNPDFLKRLKLHKDYMFRLLKDEAVLNARRFINREAIAEDLRYILELEDQTFSPLISRTTAWGIALIAFLHWLEKKDFLL